MLLECGHGAMRRVDCPQKMVGCWVACPACSGALRQVVSVDAHRHAA